MGCFANRKKEIEFKAEQKWDYIVGISSQGPVPLTR
jgi:hypothetical protein